MVKREEHNVTQSQQNAIDIVTLAGKVDTLAEKVKGTADIVQQNFALREISDRARHEEVLLKFSGVTDFIALVNKKADEAREHVIKVDKKQAWMMGIAGGLGVAFSKLIDYFTGSSGSGHH